MRTKLLQTFVLGAAFGAWGCSATSSPSDEGASGGNTSAGGNFSTAGGIGVGSGGTNVGSGGGATAIGGTTNIAGSGFGYSGAAGASSGGSTAAAGFTAGGNGSTAGTGFGGTTGQAGFGQGGVGQAGFGQGGIGQGGFGQAGSSQAGAAQGGAGAGGSGQAGGAGTSAGGMGAGGGTTVACNGPALSGATQHCSNNASGTANGFTWTIWSSGASGGCMNTYNTGAAYKATWNNAGDFLAREGFQWDETKTYDQLGTISADFAYTKTGTAGGYSYIGIYGWSNNPLVEYYIVDDWFGNGPPTGGGTHKGSFTIDGAQYDIYMHTQTNQPSIHGTQTFPQFFSVRKTARQCGHISISEHFKEWGTLGMNLGKMYEAKILVEVGGGQGSIDFSAATMTAK